MRWLWEKCRYFQILRRQRLQLLAMDERMRKDLAISRVDAEQFAGRYGSAQNSQQRAGEKTWKK